MEDCGMIEARSPVPLPMGEGTVLRAPSAIQGSFSQGEKDRMRGIRPFIPPSCAKLAPIT